MKEYFIKLWNDENGCVFIGSTRKKNIHIQAATSDQNVKMITQHIFMETPKDCGKAECPTSAANPINEKCTLEGTDHIMGITTFDGTILTS